MDDIAGKLSEFLQDPEAISKLKGVAENLLGNQSKQNDIPTEAASDSFSLPDGFDLGKIMGLMSVFKNQKQDHRSELLIALKPHLSEHRREKVDQAVKLLKIIALLPVLREQGLLDIF
ncbi:MAG: hypothetical protein J6Q76_05020 [Clostridia bacterium]|nr:hypothetical protein [Clostridia bacterium]